MGKPQTFDIIAVSIPDSNVRMAVARLMVGADRYLSMQAALDKVKTPPALIFHNTDTREAEQHVAKLKSLGVGFRVVRSDGSDGGLLPDDEPDAVLSAEDVVVEDNKGGEAQAAALQTLTEAATHENAQSRKPATESVRDVILRHRYGPVDGIGESGGAGGRGGTGKIASHLDYLRKREAASRKKSVWVSVIASLIIVIFGVLFLLSHKDNKFRVEKISIPGSAGAANGKTAANKPAKGSEKRRGKINSRQRQQADAYVDSARTGDPDMERQVAFYKIAISFNRYNLQAWHGLLQTYRDMEKLKEARETEAEMTKIFGDDINSVNAAVAQFGELSDTYVGDGGIYRVEYKTQKTSKDEVLRDVFNMTRAVRNTCKCKNISIHASTGPAGKGLTVVSTAETSMHTLPEFSKQAEIMWED